jgi:hypothetical protein
MADKRPIDIQQFAVGQLLALAIYTHTTDEQFPSSSFKNLV